MSRRIYANNVVGLVGVTADDTFCSCDVPGCRVYFVLRGGGYRYVWDGESRKQWKINGVGDFCGFRTWNFMEAEFNGTARAEFRRAIQRYMEGVSYE
jgi:hypothetical protein